MTNSDVVQQSWIVLIVFIFNKKVSDKVFHQRNEYNRASEITELLGVFWNTNKHQILITKAPFCPETLTSCKNLAANTT